MQPAHPTHDRSGIEAYELVEGFEQLWSQRPKHMPLRRQHNGQTVFEVFFRASELHAHAALVIGPKGGIEESIVVIDPTQRIVADRLLVHSISGGELQRGLLFPLAALRHQVLSEPRGRRQKALNICWQALQTLIGEIDSEAPKVSSTQLRSMPSTSFSIHGIFGGGAPGMGRRGGGTPGSH